MGRRPKKRGTNCGACGKEIDGEGQPHHVGAVVTRSGSKFVCSGECFLELMKRDDVCTLGDLEEQHAMQDVLAAELRLARVRAERKTARRVIGRLQGQMIESAIEALDEEERSACPVCLCPIVDGKCSNCGATEVKIDAEPKR